MRTLPIPEPRPSEVYAGLILGEDFTPDYHLFLSIKRPVGQRPWLEAGKWALQVGGELPTRRELLLLIINCGKHLNEGFYWTCEKYPDNHTCVWIVETVLGHTDYAHSATSCQVCAVRRVPVEGGHVIRF